jgi:hypothetical protein
MGYYKLQRLITNITRSGSSVSLPYSDNPRGAILLSVNLTWCARDYYDIGTVDQSTKFVNVHVVLTDPSSSFSILDPLTGAVGQQALNPIVVTAGGFWNWEHPKKREITSVADYISKLSFAPNFTVGPLGVIRGTSINIITSTDPIFPSAIDARADLMFEAEFLAFESALT